ncbi:hypothetical protein JEQ12_006596 [Ovis aries]|uniref:Fatty acid desaturase domain-containing protein n=1 Tax=Ovis aries TaxID=9940 RepID=A0A835ZUV6_SHEEP|nr:hypothetical protein JEQ12_006596 [Ovis aries]
MYYVLCTPKMSLLKYISGYYRLMVMIYKRLLCGTSEIHEDKGSVEYDDRCHMGPAGGKGLAPAFRRVHPQNGNEDEQISTKHSSALPELRNFKSTSINICIFNIKILTVTFTHSYYQTWSKTVGASYAFIIAAILRIHSTQGRLKAFSTCSSHLISVTLYYGSILYIYSRPSSSYSLERDKVLATCNVEYSFFNDWFTGHLNFQIEHHLFPTMPRHNCHKVAPLVKSLCAKHGLPYVNKPMLKAFGDILRALKKYGALWKEAYCTHPEI